MAERTIVGVDFSGAKENENRESTWNTWITEAELLANDLEIKCCRPLQRTTLTADLKKLPPGAVVAMDFPFSLPQKFIVEELNPNAITMDDAWRAVSEISASSLDYKLKYACFERKRDYFVGRHGEIHRRGDLCLKGPFSPLHKARPSLVQMTFFGMLMLNELWECKSPRFIIPPLPQGKRDGPILLETMPGVLLRLFALPHQRYKTYTGLKQKKERLENRERILNGLENLPGLSIKIIDKWRDQCRSNHDCLDSLVAAVGAAMWAKDETKFCRPEDKSDQAVLDAARLEGWIYAPKQ